MRNFLDLKRLRYFRTIAEHGSLSAAARALHLAQPALSHHVGELESQLGAALLVRRHNGVELTDAGRRLLKHATDITSRVERAEAELSRLAQEQGGRITVRLAIISSLAADLTPVLVGAVSRGLPEVALRIIESRTRDSRLLLDQDEADIAISLSPESPQDTPAATEQLYFVTAQDLPGTETISFADALSGPLVMPATGNPLRALVDAAATEYGRDAHVALEVNGAIPRLNAVLAGLGGTIVGAHTVLGGDRMAGLVARRIAEPALFRPIYIGVRRSFDPDLAARLLPVLGQVLAETGGMLVDAAV
jgi:LysR family nitrogen assimilation transcriptional regulator